VETIKRQTRVV